MPTEKPNYPGEYDENQNEDNDDRNNQLHANASGSD
jgi:hypothetical protein